MDIFDPLITIVTVSYNSVHTIERTIKSVLNQSYSHIEYLIIDGGSADGTLDIIKNYETQFQRKNIFFNYISEKDKGIYDAMNKGIGKSKGMLIGILNSDDWYEEDAVSKVVLKYEGNPEYDIFHGILRNTDQEGTTTSIIGYTSGSLKQHMIQHPTCFVSKALYEKEGVYDTSLKSAADYELMLRFQSKGAKFLFIEEILANFTQGGVSSNIKSLQEDYLVKHRYNIIPYSKYAFLSFYLKIKSKLS